MSENVEPAIGIDLGTTYSVVALVDRDGRPKTIENEEGELTTPSVVFFDKDAPVVGREAIRAAEFEPERLAQFFKRDMGDSSCQKEIVGHSFRPEVVQALVLRKLKRDAERKVGAFTKAVVTVPAYFNEPRRKATQDAGRMAGVEVIDIINEPTAAAIAYGVEQGFLSQDGVAKQRELVLVYDLGGGTFDATLMEIEGSDFSAVATAGDVYLGGIDWDSRIVEYLAKQFQEEHGVDPLDDVAARERLLHDAAQAKRTLTARQETTVPLSYDGLRSRLTITRQQFESMTADLLDRTRLTINRLLREAELSWGDVSRLLLVGGSTRMPMVGRMLEVESGLTVDRSLSPDMAVAHGAAIYAGLLLQQGEAFRRGVSIQNVNSHHLGVMGIHPQTRTPKRHVMIPKNTRLPAAKSSMFTTAKDNQPSVAVRVVEGGTDTGEGATEIGKCVVADLPPNLPRGTQVRVVFQYGSDGRLTVQADVPTVQSQTRMVIDRASGLSEEELNEWKSRIEEGIATPAESPPEAIGQLEPVDVQQLTGLDELEDELQFSEEDLLGDQLAPPETKTSISEEEVATPDSRDPALDDFLKGLGE